MTDTAIELENITYIYPDGTMALNNINLKVLKGERLAILGPNGAGKSTLIMHLNGLFTPTKGMVKVMGKPISKENPSEIRKSVGIVFQNPDDQLFCPTLWEDIAFGPLNLGLSEKEVEERVAEALKTVGLVGYENKAPHHLSIGERKKAAIASVLAMKPEILILDEPTSNLDPKSSHDLIQFLNGLHAIYKVTLVLATHDVNIVPLLADRVYILNMGKIVAEGSTKEILSSPNILREARLELPTITQLFYSLRDQGYNISPSSIPLTVKEAINTMEFLVKNIKTKREKRLKQKAKE